MLNPRRLTQARGLADVKLVHLASRVGVHRARVHKWEWGLASPSDDTVRMLALALGVTTDFLRRPDFHWWSIPHAQRWSKAGESDSVNSLAQLAIELLISLRQTIKGPTVERILPAQDAAHDHWRDPTACVREVRRALGKGPGIIAKPIRMIEAHGLLALSMPEVASRAIWHPIAPVIVLGRREIRVRAAQRKSRLPWLGQRLDVITSLALLLMPELRNDAPVMRERAAEVFARKFLRRHTLDDDDHPTLIDSMMHLAWQHGLSASHFRRELGVGEEIMGRLMAALCVDVDNHVEPEADPGNVVELSHYRSTGSNP